MVYVLATNSIGSWLLSLSETGLAEPGRSAECGERDKSKVVFIRFGVQGVKEASNCNYYGNVRWNKGGIIPLSPHLVIDGETSPQVLLWRGLFSQYRYFLVSGFSVFFLDRFCKTVIDWIAALPVRFNLYQNLQYGGTSGHIV